MPKRSTVVAVALALIGVIPPVHASLIGESEPNDTNNSATVRHEAIRAAPSETLDNYRFTVDSAGADGYFDIDNSGGAFDNEIAVWDAAENLAYEEGSVVGDLQGDDCIYSKGVQISCITAVPGRVLTGDSFLEPIVHWAFENPGDAIGIPAIGGPAIDRY